MICTEQEEVTHYNRYNIQAKIGTNLDTHQTISSFNK